MSSFPSEISQISRSAILPLRFSYEQALRLRRMVIAAELDLPLYLLAPEVAVLLSYVPDLRQRMLLETLWNTGARINEALAIAPYDFDFNELMPFVRVITLKQRRSVKRARKGVVPGRAPGRPARDAPPPFRPVSLPDAGYVRRIREYITTFRCKKYEPIWNVSAETVRSWIRAAVVRAERDGVTFSVKPVTPKTFRHSFAMHLLFNCVALKQVQALMGHKRIENTEIYTKIFSFDLTPALGVSFSMGTEDALAIVRSTESPDTT
ncbi:tyrosine-type recombinase/integrase [Salmonella enterica]|nr:tyrosine-type recombinase/integrase [Salmonella enterica]